MIIHIERKATTQGPGKVKKLSGQATSFEPSQLFEEVL